MLLTNIFTKIRIIIEGYGKTLSFDYPDFNIDPSPNILLLGTYRHRRTGNNLVAGINLNYVKSKFGNRGLEALQEALPEILGYTLEQSGKSTRKQRPLRNTTSLLGRYWSGRTSDNSMVRSIFTEYYRTYKASEVGPAQKGTLKFKLPSDMSPETEKDMLQKQIEKSKTTDIKALAQPPKKPIPKLEKPIIFKKPTEKPVEPGELPGVDKQKIATQAKSKVEKDLDARKETPIGAPRPITRPKKEIETPQDEFIDNLAKEPKAPTEMPELELAEPDEQEEDILGSMLQKPEEKPKTPKPAAKKAPTKPKPKEEPAETDISDLLAEPEPKKPEEPPEEVDISDLL